jgi:hypothetical protein
VPPAWQEDLVDTGVEGADLANGSKLVHQIDDNWMDLRLRGAIASAANLRILRGPSRGLIELRAGTKAIPVSEIEHQDRPSFRGDGSGMNLNARGSSCDLIHPVQPLAAIGATAAR